MAFNQAKPQHKEGDGLMAVPRFGGWDQKAGVATPDYSMVFTRARANKMHQKVNATSTSLGNEKELLNVPLQQTEKNSAKKDGWMAVPQFGGWDQKAGGPPMDYSMVFTRARANRKQQKLNVGSSSLGNEKEFLNFPLQRTEQNSTMKKWSFFSCLSCRVKN